MLVPALRESVLGCPLPSLDHGVTGVLLNQQHARHLIFGISIGYLTHSFLECNGTGASGYCLHIDVGDTAQLAHALKDQGLLGFYADGVYVSGRYHYVLVLMEIGSLSLGLTVTALRYLEVLTGGADGLLGLGVHIVRSEYVKLDACLGQIGGIGGGGITCRCQAILLYSVFLEQCGCQ